MKKIDFVKKNVFRTVSALLLAAAAFLATGCYDVIFDDIKKEVELVEASVLGEINSIVRSSYTGLDGNKHEYLYVATGKIWEKNVDSETTQVNGTLFKEIACPPSDFTFYLASDANYLYALGVNVEENASEGEMAIKSRILYALPNDLSKGIDWIPVSFSDGISLNTNKKAVCSLFCTNSPNPANRFAFINNGGQLYYIDGTGENPVAKPVSYDASASGTAGPLAFTGANSLSVACAYYEKNGTRSLRFHSSKAIVTDETKTSAPKYLYYKDSDGKIYAENAATGEKSGGVVVSNAISMLCTKDSLIVGTTGGVTRVLISDGKGNWTPPVATVGFTTNASSTLSSYYRILALLCIDCTRPETDCEMYATITFSDSTSSTSALFKRIGLWSYYAARGNWNRE